MREAAVAMHEQRGEGRSENVAAEFDALILDFFVGFEHGLPDAVLFDFAAAAESVLRALKHIHHDLTGHHTDAAIVFSSDFGIGNAVYLEGSVFRFLDPGHRLGLYVDVAAVDVHVVQVLAFSR